MLHTSKPLSLPLVVRRWSTAVVVVVVVALVAACRGGSTGLADGVGTPAKVADLDGSYLLVSSTEDGVEHPPASTSGYVTQATFDGGQLHVWGECNDVLAHFDISREGRLSLTDLRGPRGSCDAGPLREEGRRIDVVVTTGAGVSIEGAQVRFTKDGISVTFEPKPGDPSAGR